MNRRTLLILAIVLVSLLIACIACAAVGGLGFLWFWESELDLPADYTGPNTQAPTPNVVINNDPASDETLRVLEQTIVPENDPADIASRLQGILSIPDSVPYAGPSSVGDQKSFYVTNSDTNETSLRNATLRYAGDIVYFWIENGVNFDQGDLERLARAFETQMYPINRSFFGSEWSPGIDNDPHIYILYTTGMGFNVAGYFSSADEIHPIARPDSNAHEMFLINAGNSPLDDEYTYGVLAHEYQHMIHWNTDRNETSWLNEGLSELATLLNGYVHTGFIQQYASNPDHQLNDWPNHDYTTPYYGAAFSFVTYFLERFGNEATQALVADPANGLDSIDNVLLLEAATDGITGQQILADDVVLDWVITNYLNDAGVADGRYHYRQYGDEVYVRTYATETVSDCPSAPQTRDVKQYGVDYITITCSGTLNFSGSTSTQLIPQDAYSGRYAFWSNKGDESDMTLTREFDLREVSGPVSLDYYIWYNIEEDWDYGYVLASTNGGVTWDFLQTPNGTGSNPTGGNYGWGYTGFSGGSEPGSWIKESVDISAYAGQQVLLRFEYITDAAVNGEGFMVDDVSIPAINYFEDFESGSGGWEAAGFARIENALPQSFRLALIHHGATPTVEILDVPAGNTLQVDLQGDDEVTLVVMGATRFTRQAAAYQFWFE
ncbi:MAG: immune inhibitor A [Anaerolineales bacterium]|nr:MAG: immune inhibitor A [Anaerolineales bacterium]